MPGNRGAANTPRHQPPATSRHPLAIYSQAPRCSAPVSRVASHIPPIASWNTCTRVQCTSYIVLVRIKDMIVHRIIIPLIQSTTTLYFLSINRHIYDVCMLKYINIAFFRMHTHIHKRFIIYIYILVDEILSYQINQ